MAKTGKCENYRPPRACHVGEEDWRSCASWRISFTVRTSRTGSGCALRFGGSLPTSFTGRASRPGSHATCVVQRGQCPGETYATPSFFRPTGQPAPLADNLRGLRPSVMMIRCTSQISFNLIPRAMSSMLQSLSRIWRQIVFSGMSGTEWRTVGPSRFVSRHGSPGRCPDGLGEPRPFGAEMAGTAEQNWSTAIASTPSNSTPPSPTLWPSPGARGKPHFSALAR